MALYRLDKYLADAGIGTRTEIKNYIKKGFVYVNGETAKKPDCKVNSDTDTVSFQGNNISLSPYEYYILNKPSGYVSATKDNTAPTVMELIETRRKDLAPVGRLDKDTEGLLLITNDGALSHFLLSPKRHVDKTYFALVSGIMNEEDVKAFEDGLYIGDPDWEQALPATLEIKNIQTEENKSEVYITIHEGKFHQIKRMVKAVGKEVTYLKRTRFGPLSLPTNLELGQSRPLTKEELLLLKESIGNSL